MPTPPPTRNKDAYFVRRPDGTVIGPYDAPAIAALLAARKLDGSEDVSVDRKAWRSVRTLGAAASAGTPAAASRGPRVDLDADGADSFAPLEIGFGGPPSVANPSGAGAAAPPGDDADAGIDIGPTLELVERNPARSPAPAPPASTPRGSAVDSSLSSLSSGTTGAVPASSPEPGASLPARPLATARSPSASSSPSRLAPLTRAPPASPPGPVERAPLPGAADFDSGLGGPPTGARAPSTFEPPVMPIDPIGDASAAVASLLQGEEGHTAGDATAPISLQPATSAPQPRARPRTLTARLGGPPVPSAPGTRRVPRRALVAGGLAVVLAGAAAAALVLDLPERVRGEPPIARVLAPVAAELAQDRFGAFAEGARLLEEAVAGRRRVPTTRATAAALLAASVVIHGGERGRIARAEALLDAGAAGAPAPRGAGARARAWIALAKGRWKDAEELAAAPEVTDGDRATLLGWAALGREAPARAAGSFTGGERAEPAPFPSRVAALFALGRAREAELSPGAEAAYRAVLAASPAHVGAALGLARTAKLAPVGRQKLAEAVLAKQAAGASRIELAEAYAIVARAAHELGDPRAAAAAEERARAVDPSGAEVALLGGDALLAEGRTDEAIARYKTALLAPLGVPRTSALRFARLAVAVESGRAVDAAALAELDQRLPGDPRTAFWQARAAEHATPPDLGAAEHAYRVALERGPRFLPASLGLARLLMARQRPADALTVLRQAESRGAAPRALRAALGQALLAAGDGAGASRAFQEVLATEPRDLGAGLGLAAARKLQGDAAGARAALDALLARPDAASFGARIAELLVELGRRDDALAAYQKEIDAGHAPATTKVTAARLALTLGKTEPAARWAESAVADDPRTPGALLTLAEVRRASGDLTRALGDLQRALAVDGSPEVELEYGRALAALGRNEEALAALAEARQLPQASIERGRILLRRGEVEAAAKELGAAVADLPGSAEARLLSGDAEDRLGHAPAAEAAWRAAVRLSPGLAEARYRLGRLELDRGHAALALPHLRAAEAHLSPDGTADGSWRADLYFQLGTAEQAQGSRPRALAAFRRYLELAPADAPARAEVTREIAALGN